VVISVNMLECVADPTALIHDIARVLKPHGRILCCHWDWDTQVYASEQRDRIRRMVQAYSDWHQGWMDHSDGMIGRKLWGLFQSTGHFAGNVNVFTLVETSYTPGDCGYDRLNDLASLAQKGEIDTGEYEAIKQEMKTLAQQKRYFYSLNAYTYVGKKCR
jgi:SAM-dependent methyltransferase